MTWPTSLLNYSKKVIAPLQGPKEEVETEEEKDQELEKQNKL